MLQPKPKFTPPSDAIVVESKNTFVPPSDAIVLKKKESTESTSTTQEKNLESVQTVGSLDGVGSNGFPAIDQNLGVPGLKPDLKTVEQLANPPKSKSTLQAEQNNALKYQKFKEFSTLPDEIKKENAQKVEDEVNGVGFLNNVATFGKEAYNTVIEGMSNTPMTVGLKELKVNTEPLADEKKEAKDLMIRQGVKPKDINSNTILELAKKIKIQKLNDSDVESRKKEFLSNTEIDFEDLQKGANSELSKISNKDKELLKQKAMLEPVLRDSDNRLTELNKQLANFKKNNQQPTPEFVDEYNYAIKYHNDIVKDVQKTDNQFADNRDKIGDLKTNLDLFKRQYGKVNNFVSNIGATALDLAAGGFGIVDYGFNAAYGALGIDTGPKENSEIVTGLRGASKNIRDRIAKPINIDNIEDAGDFGDWMANTVIANQVPIYGLIATGPGGIVALGGSSLGTKYGDMVQEMNPDNPVAGQILKDYSDVELAWKPIGFGIAETASALVDAHIMKGAARVLASATQPERRLISQTIAKRLLNVGKQTIKGGTFEAIDESATQGVENLIDGKPFTEGMKDAGGAGAAMGALIPFFAGNIAVATKSFSIDNKIQNSAKKTLALEKELANPNLSEDAKKIIKTNFEESKKTTENLLKKQVKDISKMSNENFQEILRIENEQAKLKEKAIEIKTQEGLSDNIKKQLLSDFSNKFNNLETDRLDILSGKKTMPKIENENEKPEEVAVTETKLQAEVPQQAEAEKVEELRDSPEISQNQEVSPVEDVVATSVEKPKEIWEMDSDEFDDNIIFQGAPTSDSKSRFFAPSFETSKQYAFQLGATEGEVRLSRYNNLKKEQRILDDELVTAIIDRHGKQWESLYGKELTKKEYERWSGEFLLENANVLDKIPASELKKKGFNPHTYIVEKAIAENKYVEAIKDKKLTVEDVIKIIESANIEVPKNILDLQNEATPPTNNPANGNLSIGTSNVGESGNSKQETPKPQEVSPVEDVVAKSVEKKTIKQLEAENKTTLPKIPSNKIFKNEVTPLTQNQTKGVDKIIEQNKENDLPTQKIDIGLIVPTQKTVNTNNLKKTSEITEETKISEPIVLVKENGKYYVVDGHHRISNEILNGNTIVEAKVFDNEATPETNTPTNGNVQSRTSNVGESGVTEQQSPTKESVPSSVDVGKDKGYAEIENIDEIANFLKDEFINPKQEEKVVEKPKATKEQVVEPVKETKLEQAKGFVSMAVKNLTTSLKDFQGRAKEYSEDTYNRIVNEAKEGVLNISSIPPIQIWKNPETGQFVILAGHSRTKAFSDLAEGKVEFADKYKKSDFEKVNTQIVEAETLEEAQKIAQESNQGSAQTVVDNAKYVRESLLSTFQNFNQAKTKLKSLYGPAWARIYAYANLNPKGKAMQMLKLFQDANESDSNDKSKKIAEWTGKTRADFDKLTDAHENEIFDFLSKNDKIKTYSELSELLNRRVNGLEEFNSNEPLNFEQKVGRGSNEVEIVKEIQDLKNRDVQIKKKIKELQSFGKNINDTQRKQIKDLTAESIKINTVDIPNAQKKQKQARAADAEQFDIFSQINEQVENGNITPEQVDEFVNDDRKAEEIEPIVEVIESKAKGYNKAELEEVVAEVDAVLANEENKQSEYKFSNSPSLKNAQAVDSSVLPITPKATENILKNEGTWNKAIIGDVKNLGNGWFEVGKTVKGESILYSPTTDKAVTIVDSENKGGRNAVYVNDFINNNPTILEKQQLKDKANAEIDTDLVSKEYYEKFQKDFPNTLLAIEEKNGLITIFENGETREVEDYEFVKELKNALAKGYKGIVKVTRKVVDTETKKLRANAEVDRIAQKIKDILPGIDDPDLKKQGFSQDQLIDLVASTVKTLVSKGIDINDAIRQVIASIKERFNVDVDENLVKEKLGVEKEISKDELSDFRDLIRDIPQKDEVKNYLSGETIERVHGETRNDQSYNVVSLADLSLHGKLVMDKAKELFGDQYVEKTLEFIESANLEADEKAIQYVALENEMDKRVSENPNDLGERKLQDLVRKKSQAHLRKSAIAINAGRLRAIMKYGIDVNSYPDEILTSKQKQAKSEIEKLVQHTSEDINKEAEIQEEEGGVIISQTEKEIKSNSKKAKEVANKIRQYKIHKPSVFSSASPGSLAWDGAIEIIAKTVEAGGTLADAIQKGIEHIKATDWYKNLKDDKKKEAEDALSDYVEKALKPKDKKIQDIVKQALIDAGFSRKVKIKGEEKTLLDWKKLAGEESSIPKLKENVEKSLKGQGYTDSQIKEIGKSLEDEYIRLGADIVEKGLRELENRNKLKPSPTRKTDAKRLSELYNYGLFNGEKATEYDNLLNKTLGLSEFDVETYQKIKSLAKALASVYNQENNGRKISEIAVQTLNSTINHQIKSLLATSALKNGTKAFNVFSAFDDYVGLSMRALLGSVSTLTENKISGEFQVQLQKAFSSGEITPELKKQIEADKKAVFRDITRNAGLFYGDTNTSLTHSSRFEEWLNGKADKAMAHTVVSSFLLRAFLDGVDSSVKVRLTQKAFVKNVIKLLTSETNPNGKMNTEEAIKYVSEQLTGENFEKALKTAKSIIENVNEEQGEKVIKDTDEAIHRFAMDLVKENLLSSNMLTMDNIESAYKSAYKSSGRSIGHEANNVISAGVNLLSSTLNKRLEKAIQEKNYPLATSLTLLSTIQKSILNPFVGGGTNWVILGLEKSGNPLGYISVIHNATERRKLDLSENKSDITQSLYRESIYKDSAVRLLVGTGLAMAMFAVLTAGDDDEELLGKLNQWLKDNPWAKKHFNKLAPEAVTFLIDMKNGELSKHWQKILGMKNDYFDNIKTLINTFSDENSSMSGAFGAFVGQNLSSPGPWKTIKDVRDILRGLKGLPEIKTDYKTSGFWNGYFRAGLVDFAKLRPEVNYDLNSKIDKVKDDAKKLNSEIDSFVKKIYDDKLPNDQINKKINELFDKEPLKKEKIINAIKNRAEEEKLKRSGVDPFYIKLKRESNDEIKAILFQDRFKDLSKTTPAEQKEIEKGMNAIKFGEGSKEFWNTYWRLAHPENYKNKPIN